MLSVRSSCASDTFYFSCLNFPDSSLGEIDALKVEVCNFLYPWPTFGIPKYSYPTALQNCVIMVKKIVINNFQNTLLVIHFHLWNYFSEHFISYIFSFMKAFPVNTSCAL